MMKRLTRRIIIMMVIMLFLVSPMLVRAEDNVRRTRNYFDYFGSMVSVQIWVPTSLSHEAVFDEIDNILDHIHQNSTKYDAFDGVVNINYINDNPGIVHTVDPLLIEMIQLSIEYYNHPLAGQKYNIALGAVLEVWSEYRNRCLDSMTELEPNCALPPLSELEAAATMIDPNLIVIDDVANTILIPEGLRLDLGGIAKGYGAHIVAEYLRATDIDIFIVNAGSSNIEFFGPHPSGERDYFVGGLRNPFSPSKTYARIKVVSGENIVTSGDYERFYFVDGEAYHHLIDPETLFPGEHIRATTVVSKDPVLGDIYSTIAFLLPIEESIAFIDSIPDAEAIWVTASGDVYFSAQFETLYLYELLPIFDEDTPPANNFVFDTTVVVLLSILGVITVVFVAVVMKDKLKPPHFDDKENPSVD